MSLHRLNDEFIARVAILKCFHSMVYLYRMKPMGCSHLVNLVYTYTICSCATWHLASIEMTHRFPSLSSASTTTSPRRFTPYPSTPTSYDHPSSSSYCTHYIPLSTFSWRCRVPFLIGNLQFNLPSMSTFIDAKLSILNFSLTPWHSSSHHDILLYNPPICSSYTLTFLFIHHCTPLIHFSHSLLHQIQMSIITFMLRIISNISHIITCARRKSIKKIFSITFCIQFKIAVKKITLSKFLCWMVYDYLCLESSISLICEVSIRSTCIQHIVPRDECDTKKTIWCVTN